MSDLGKLLKQERNKQSLSLKELSEKTKIPLHTLEAIEEGHQKQLPAKPYVKGFVRSYAKILGLDIATIIELFESEFGATEVVTEAESIGEPTDEVSPPPKESVLWFQAPRSFFLIFGFALTILLCIFIYVTLQKLQSYKGEIAESTQTAEIEVSNKEKINQIGEAKKNEAIGETELDSSETDSKYKVVINDDDDEDSLANIAKAQDKKLSKLVDESEKAPVKKPKPTLRRQNKLVIEAFEPVRLEILWSTGDPQIFLLKSNEIKNIIFSKNVKIRLSDGGVINIIFNQKDMGVPGQIRKPIELSYP